MPKNSLSVRELQQTDIEHLASYWLDSDTNFLIGMGVDLAKLPTRTGLTKMLKKQLVNPLPKKQSYCVIWELNGKPIGHSNINKIRFGKEAFMHLHLWNSTARKKGIGSAFVKMTLPYFFEKFELKRLFCEPYALNPAPNKTLEKTGFTFIKKHLTIPGSLNFEQEVNLWVLSLANFKLL